MIVCQLTQMWALFKYGDLMVLVEWSLDVIHNFEQRP